MQTDYFDPPPPPQGHTHRQYYGYLLPKDVATTWHKTYCEIHGINLHIPHPICPDEFLKLNSMPVAIGSLAKKIGCQLYNEPVYTDSRFKEKSICIAFVQYPQSDLPYAKPTTPTNTAITALAQELAHSGINVGPSDLGWYSYVWSLVAEAE